MYATVARLVLLSEIVNGLVSGEMDRDQIHLAAATAARLSGEAESPFVAGILAALDPRHERWRAVLRTISRARRLAADYPSAELSDPARATEAADITALRLVVRQQRLTPGAGRILKSECRKRRSR